MLDHGLHFDIDHDLRINYSKLWLSFMSPTTSKSLADRRKYAELVGNIGPDLVSALPPTCILFFSLTHPSTMFSKLLSQVV